MTFPRSIICFFGVLAATYTLGACGSESDSEPPIQPVTDIEIAPALSNPDLATPELEAGVSAITPLIDSNSENLSILFIGNSYLTHQPYLEGTPSKHSVAKQIVDMMNIEFANVKRRIHSIGGGTLEQHWEKGEGEGTARYDLSSGQFDVLIIQGRFDILDGEQYKDRFNRYANLFAELASKNGTKVVFYGLWATDAHISSERGDSFGPAAHEIYCQAAARNNATCAPNGIAYKLVYDSLAEVLDDETIEATLTYDSIHPFIPVAYMAASVVYSTLLGKEPLTLEQYHPPGTSEKMGELMRQSAWAATARTW
ncbi:hypothetical protein AB833_26770 [Chromatiales bacterium (ex Bugula neritina AB1)]|nr:hypothetical protein AB833_26770 [Chromatiales bacterium (ex Bugula neritina AB1)]